MRLRAALASILLLIPLASGKGCEPSSDTGGHSKAPAMIANGKTKITRQMVGAVYTTKGPTDSAKRKGLQCEWRVIDKHGVGGRFSIANGPMSIKFLPRDSGGTFDSRFCRMWIRHEYA